jgi:NDP-sugar pyrophosphorylase family protein
MRARHHRTSALATMLIKEVPDAHKWGAIETDHRGRVLRIIGKGDPAAPAAHACMFTGVHLVSPRLVDRLPKSGESDSIRQGYVPALLEGEHIEGVLHTGYFHEHSTPARYLEGNLNCLQGRARLRYAPGPFTGIDPSARIDPSALLVEPLLIGARARVGAGCIIGPGVVLGHDAMVDPQLTLEETVVWPRVNVTRSHGQAIVTEHAVIDARG